MNANRRNNTQSSTIIVDRFAMSEQQKNNAVPTDAQREAGNLAMISRVLGDPIRLMATINENDEEGILAYNQYNYDLRRMNGNRSEALSQFLESEMDRQMPDKMVIVGEDPSFQVMCMHASNHGTQIEVWHPSLTPPAWLARYYARPLDHVLPPEYLRVDSAKIWIDLENVLFSLKNKGCRVNIQKVIKAIQKEVSNLNTAVTGIYAYADFADLDREFGINTQRKLEEMGIKTHYQISQHGKNSSDMSIAQDIHNAIERDSNLRNIIMVTGDRDFRPSIDKAHEHGIKVWVIALRDNLSRELARAADDVRYLDEHFVSQTAQGSNSTQNTHPNPNDPQADFLFKVAYRLHQNKWRWAYLDKLADIASPEALQAALDAGLLRPGQAGSKNTVALNEENKLANAVRHFVSWVMHTLDKCLKVKKFPYVDSNYIVKGMEMNEKCQAMMIGYKRANGNAWLDAAAKAGVISKKQQQHPKTDRTINTWWFVEDTNPAPGVATIAEDTSVHHNASGDETTPEVEVTTAQEQNDEQEQHDAIENQNYELLSTYC